MAISAKITLTTAGGNTGPFNLYSNTDTYATAFATGITRSALLAGYTSDVVPTGTSSIRVTSVNETCSNHTDLPLILPSATPTATPTQTVTPTATQYKYYFKLLRCDMDPNDPANSFWTMHSYASNAMSYGDLFKSGGGYYYTVVDHSLTDQGGIIEGSKSTDYDNCGEVPGHWVSATYRTAHINLFRSTGLTSYQDYITYMCDKTPSQFPSGFISSGAYADATITGTSLTPGILYDLYSSNIDGTPKWTSSGSHYWGVFNTATSKVDKIVRIVDGTITEWRNCTNGDLITYP